MSNWYVDYVDEKVTPLYSFGHGLSYTTFAYENLSLSAKGAASGESIAITLKVTNTGKVAGDEVVQLYLRDVYASAPRPVKELKGYIRVGLDPKESKTVTFHLPIDQLAFYDNDLELVVEAGEVQVCVERQLPLGQHLGQLVATRACYEQRPGERQITIMTQLSGTF